MDEEYSKEMEQIKAKVIQRNLEIMSEFKTVEEFVKYKAGVKYIVSFLNAVFMHPFVLKDVADLIAEDRVFSVAAYLQAANTDVFKLHQNNMKAGFIFTLKQMSTMTSGAFEWEYMDTLDGGYVLFSYFKPDHVDHAIQVVDELMRKEGNSAPLDEDYSLN